MSPHFKIDCQQEIQSLKPIWRSFGYDEINWTYTPLGKEAFKEISLLSDAPYYIRCHHTFTSGNGLSTPTKGSTNLCVGIRRGQLELDFSLWAQALDTILEAGCKPIVELGFMPDILSSGTKPKPSYNYAEADLWMYPPKDYRLWQDLVYKSVQYCVARYGEGEVSAWYWELWNEPDNPGFFRGGIRHYCKMYDFAVAGATAALNRIQIGGPGLATSVRFLDKFLKHCHSGKNAATGKKGTRLDFISMHAKGTDWPLKGQSFKMPSLQRIIRHFEDYRTVLTRHPVFLQTPWLMDECDMAVATNFGMYDFKEYEFNNTTYYPVFVIRMAKAIWDFCLQSEVEVSFFTTWAFYFEGKRFFEGNRALFTNRNIKLPVFNAFDLMEKLGSRRLRVQGDGGEVEVLATKNSAGQLAIMAWHFVESDVSANGDKVRVRFEIVVNVDKTQLKGKLIRIDRSHSNSYEKWKELGRSQNPTLDEISKIKAAGNLDSGRSIELDGRDGVYCADIALQQQSVFLLLLDL